MLKKNGGKKKNITPSRWKCLDLDLIDPETKEKNLSMIRLFIQSHPDAVMEHSPDWLHARRGVNKAVRIYVCYAENGSLIGYAPFFLHPSTLSFELFGISLFEYSIRRYTITATPLLSVAEGSAELISALFGELSGHLKKREVVFGLGIRNTSPFSEFIQKSKRLRKYYQVFPVGLAYQRRLLYLPENFEQYLKSMSHNTRKKTRRLLRNFESEPDLYPYFCIYTSPEQVVPFLELAQSISRRTYQKKLLGLGIDDNQDTRSLLEFAAAKGWLRSYLLFCNNKPIAFQLGYLYNGTYYAAQTGYDPDWAARSVGSIMQIYRIRDLISLGGVSKLDFLYGDNEKKRSLSNASHTEQNFYFVPRKFPLSLIAYGLRLFNWQVEIFSRFLERTELKSRIRRLLRNQAVQRE